MVFVKGQSGNPNGRPRKTQEQIDFEESCRAWASKYAIGKLIKAADSETVKESLAGTMELLNRGFGKPVETSVIEANVTSEAGSSLEEIASGLAGIVGIPADGSGAVAGKDSVDPGK